MKTATKFKMRMMRYYVTLKKNLFLWSILAVLLMIFSVGLVQVFMWGENLVKYAYHAYLLNDLNDMYNDCFDLSQELRYYENGQHSYIREKSSEKKVLQDIFWIAGVDSEDSLLCFAKDNYRGFLNRHTGKVVIPADRYHKAWLFSEGLAAVVDKDSTMKFIDTSGKEVIDVMAKYSSETENRSFLFKEGHCALLGPNGKWGLVDHTGYWAVVPQYDDITYEKRGFWVVKKDGMAGMVDDKMRLVVDPLYKEVSVGDDGIEVLKNDYIRQLFSFDGKLINSFAYTDIEDLSYKVKCVDEDTDEYGWELSPYKAYYTSYSEDDSTKVGLLSPEGIPVTPPIYREIKAVNANCFRVYYNDPIYSEGLSALINNKGQLIKTDR